jgi:hypothetical protein
MKTTNQTWVSLLTNPDSIVSVFDVPPELGSMELVKCTVNRDGPRVELKIIVAAKPDRPSKRWLTTVPRRMSFGFLFVDVSTLRIDGIASEMIGIGKLDKVNGLITFDFEALGVRLLIESKFVTISGISQV